MSGEHVEAHAEVATATATVHDPEVEVKHRSRGPKYAGPADEVRLVVIVPESTEPEPVGWSPPGIADLAGAYRECITSLVASHSPLTWESVAAWLQETYDLPRRRRQGTNDYADLHAKTVAGWARRAGLPHPRRFAQ
jgi:hypothetical protein